MRQRLQGRATVQVPEMDPRIISPTGEQVSLGGKGQAEGALGLPARPEQGITFDVPQLDAAISAPAGEQASVRAEGDGEHGVGMPLPGQVQGWACLAPYPHFSTPASRGPVLPVGACGHRGDGIEGLGKDALLEQCPGETRILHLDALQMHAAQDQAREIEATQVPPQHAQQR